MTQRFNWGLRSFAIGILMANTSWLVAQSTTQSVQGLVTDTSGAVIAGAKVTLTNQGTNVSVTTTANDSGDIGDRLRFITAVSAPRSLPV